MFKALLLSIVSLRRLGGHLLGLILGVIIISSVAGKARAAGAGIVGAEFLRGVAGARASAMGGAQTALTDDGYTFLRNPAGMSRLHQAHFSATHQRQMLNIDKEILGLSLPLWTNHTIGVGGRFEHSTDYERGEFYDGEEFTNYSGSMGGYYAYGSRTGLAWGGGFKFIRERLAGYNARSYALDFGLHYKSPRTPLRLGAVIQNLGPDITFIEVGDPLPRTVRAGWAYDFYPFSRRLTLTNDIIYLQPENITSTAFGAEFGFNDYFEFRLGYATPQDYSEAGNLHGGIGVNFATMKLDYSLSRREQFDNQHRFTLSFRFGARPEPSPRDSPYPLGEKEEKTDLLEVDLQKVVSEVKLTFRHPLIERWNREARLYFTAGEYRRAAQLWENSLAGDPDQSEIYRLLGLAYYQLGELESARRYLLGRAEPPKDELQKEQVDLGDNYRELNHRAERYFDGGNYQKSIELWKRSLRAKKQPRIFRRIGTAYYELGEYEKAREFMEAGER